jgi:hypothetical protein
LFFKVFGRRKINTEKLNLVGFEAGDDVDGFEVGIEVGE